MVLALVLHPALLQLALNRSLLCKDSVDVRHFRLYFFASHLKLSLKLLHLPLQFLLLVLQKMLLLFLFLKLLFTALSLYIQVNTLPCQV